MSHKNTKHFTFSILLYLGISNLSLAQFSADLEGGLIFNSFYNEVQIPGDEGTLFDFREDFSTSPNLYYRIRLNYTIAERHTISVLYAPFEKNYQDGKFDQPLFFNGTMFPANEELQGRYKFNSYRLTYRYLLINSESFKGGFGITAKIRDAAIRLSHQNLSSEKTDFGFVPLINFYLSYHVTPGFQAILEGDALVGPQGRAEDVFLGFGLRITDPISFKAGLRVLEGGANNDEVRNFTWFNYLATGLIISLGNR